MQGLLRAAECFNDAVMFIDTSQQSWKILHLNTAAQAKFKLYDVAVDVDGEKPVLIWDLFQPYNTDSSNNTSVSSSWRKHAGKIRNGQDFSQTVRFKEGHTSNSRGIPGFTLSFRLVFSTKTCPVFEGSVSSYLARTSLDLGILGSKCQPAVSRQIGLCDCFSRSLSTDTG